MINNSINLDQFGFKEFPEISFNQLGLSNTQSPNSLSYYINSRYLDEINSNTNIKGIICKDIDKDNFPEKVVVVVDDPVWSFFSLFNHLSKNSINNYDSVIDETVVVHPTAHIDDKNVKIGSNTVVMAGAVILEGSEIGTNCILKPNCVIGGSGFEYKRTSKGILSIYHNGKVIIHNNVDVGSNTCIDKGFKDFDTIIHDNVKIDNLVHIAHSVRIKNGAFIIASAMIAGSVVIGEDSWVGPNSTLGHIKTGKKSFISLGAVATRDVKEYQRVSGNFAIEHSKMIEHVKNISSKNDINI